MLTFRQESLMKKMALCVCRNINEDFSLFIKELFSNEYSYEILRREWQKTCASMNKHEIFEQFEFPAQI